MGILTVAVAFLGLAATFFSVVFFSVLVLVSVFLAAAGLDSFLASFTGPEAPRVIVSIGMVQVKVDRLVRCDHVWASTRAEGAELTLWTQEDITLLARCDGTVNVALEHSIGDFAEVVVGLDVLLDSLTAVETIHVSRCYLRLGMTWR